MTLRGSLTEFPLDALLGFLSSSGKTGVLRVDGVAAQGTIGFDHGRLVGAVFGEDDGEAALGALLAERNAEFAFAQDDAPPTGTLSGDLAGILARARDEQERSAAIRAVVPHDRLCFRLSERAAAQGRIELSADEWRTLLVVNGARDVGAVADALHVRKRDALSLLAALVRAGAVDAVEPAAMPLAAPAAPVPSPAPSPTVEPPPPAAPPPAVTPPPSPPPSPPPAAPPRVAEPETWAPVAAEPEPEAWPAPTPPEQPEAWPAPAPEPERWSAPPPEPETWSAPAPEPETWSAPLADAAVESPAAPPPSVAPADERLAALAGLLGTPAPAAPATPEVPAPAPVETRRHGLFGFGSKTVSVPTAAVQVAAATRAGKLAAFANALIGEYNGGRYGKGKIEGRVARLLLRVDEQAEPLDRPVPTDGDRLAVAPLDAGLLPEAQVVPYLALLITQIYDDAERAFGRDKAKAGYATARKVTLGGDPLLSSADLAGRLPKV